MIKLIHGDCLEEMKNIPDNSIDMVLTDPPYRLTSGGCVGESFNNNSDIDYKSGKIFKYNDILFSEWVPKIYKVLKNNGHFYSMVNDRNLKDLIVVAEKNNLKLLNILVWVKNNSVPNKWYLKNSEFICFFRKGGAIPINNKSSKQVNWIENITKKLHPTEKPIKLMQHYIGNSTKINELVLDPFMGSGSTAIACKNLNRSFIGIEKEKKYFDIATERINNTNRLFERIK